MALITIRRGDKINLPALSPGEPGLTNDTQEVFIGTDTGNIRIGDMTKSTYDSDNNGIVDNSDKLGGELPSYYLDRSHHTGTQSADTIVDGTVNKAFTAAEQTKLAACNIVEASSVNGDILLNSAETAVYVHDVSHPASMIVESSTKNFVSIAEKNTWTNKANKVSSPVTNNILTQTNSGDLADSGKMFNDSGTTVNDVFTATKVLDLLDGKEPTVNTGFTTQYYRGDKTWHVLNSAAVGLANVDNTSDVNKPVSTATQTALNGKIDSGLIGLANGICPLDGDIKISSIYLPSYVDDVLEYANLAALPTIGESGKIYITLDNSKMYRWSGTVYSEVIASPGTSDEVVEGVVHLFFTPARASAAAPVQTVAGRTGDVVVTKTDVGLSNVNNTSDVNKPVSTATQTALNAKEDTVTSGLTTQFYRGDKTWQVVTKSNVGLGSVDNTADIDKPVSDATQTALNGKEDTLTAGLTSQYYRGDKTWQVLDKNAVGLNNVNNTSDLNKPVSTATQTLLNYKADKITAGVDGGIVTGDSTGNIQDSGKVFSDVSNTINTIWSADKISGLLDGKEPTLSAGSNTQYYRGDKTWQTLNKTAVGLGNVDNTSDVNKPISTATQTALNLKADNTLIGAANGICPLDSTTKIASTYLPSFVDDVLEYANLASFPAVGDAGKIYVTLDTNLTYRWSGTVYVEISASPGSTDVVPEGLVNLYFTPARASAAAPVQSVAGKINIVTLVKADVGLSNVDNTSDANKPVSSATQTALNAKENTVTAGTTAQYYRGDKTWVTLDKTAVGLANVDNTSDINKPISTATATALSGKEATITAGTTAQYYRGDKTWQTHDKASVGLGNVDNTSDANKPVSTAGQTALNLKADKIVGGTTGNIVTRDVNGNILDSGKKFNDAGTTSSDILSASQIASMYVQPSTLSKVDVSLSAPQVLTNNTWTKIGYNTETKDTLSEFNTTLFRFVAQAAGRFHINARATFAHSNNTSTVRAIQLYKNGVAIQYRLQKDSNIRSNSDDDLSIDAVLELATSDYIEVFAYHNRGSNINLQSGYTNLSITEMP